LQQFFSFSASVSLPPISSTLCDRESNSLFGLLQRGTRGPSNTFRNCPDDGRQTFSSIEQHMIALGKTASLPCAQDLRNTPAQGFALPISPDGHATPASIVDALRTLAGHPPKARGGFVRGRCVRGTYAPSDQAKEITKSRSFTKPCRVLARFAVGGGNPRAMDTNNCLLRGFSFRLGGDCQRSEIFTQSAPFHFARTLGQMLAFLLARMPGRDGKPDAEKVRAFSAANPETLHQASYLAAQPPSESYARTTYWGVHAFPATNAKGDTRFIKFKVEPVGAQVTLTEDDARARSADFLNEDLGLRIAARDVRFSVMALLDCPGDPVMDVTIRWPDEDEREAVRLGTIVITGIEANEVCDEPVFNPANLAEGIGHPPDEIFAARCAAYALSQTRGR
jgi:catalase